MRKLLATTTRGLVEAAEIAESEYTHLPAQASYRVQFIQESVRKYILHQRIATTHSSTSMWYEIGAANNVLALSCLNYIKAVCVDTGARESMVERWKGSHYTSLTEYMRNWSFLDYAMRFRFEHAVLAEVHYFPQSEIFDSRTSATCATAIPPWWESFIKHLQQNPRGGLLAAGEQTSLEQIHSYSTGICVCFQPRFPDRRPCDVQPNFHETTGTIESTVFDCSHGEREEPSSALTGSELSFRSPLDLWLASKRDDIVPNLLRPGGKVEKGDRKHSPHVAAITSASLNSLHLLLRHGAAVAECETSNLYGGTSTEILGMNALAAARGRDVAFMETLLAVAERQRLPFQYYMTAHFQAVLWRQAQHAQLLESTMARQFNEALIGDLKVLIQVREGPPPDQIFLRRFANTARRSNALRLPRSPTTTLSDYHALRLPRSPTTTLFDYHSVQRGFIIHMLLRMRWGGLPGG
ncbi:hypothetical protein AYO20_09095 [Fonsecaea nubica]|uniref:Uncharacterized protein n=1 Tax=Fonsecaea nubica TaxID=856822 RepID=A0A178CLK8_9EURO|nr:hypothetical protein AYO20_09095 [Fonsecaea nubica]OAL29711.1 hypothetical protein AYO20_09095 [Fonsecaea nubica]